MINSFKLSFVLSKKMPNIGEIFGEYWQKTARPGPTEIRARPARPSPLRFAGPNGPAQFVKPEIYNPAAKRTEVARMGERKYSECSLELLWK